MERNGWPSVKILVNDLSRQFKQASRDERPKRRLVAKLSTRRSPGDRL